MLILWRKDLEKVLAIDDVVDAVDHAFVEYSRGSVEMPLRPTVSIPDQGAFSFVMPAYLGGSRSYGVKILNVYPAHSPEREKTQGVVLLFDGETGEPRAMMEASYITALRTGATSAVATKYLTPRDYRSLGILGAGAQAKAQILAVARVRPLDTIKIWNRTRARARTLGQEVASELGAQVAIVDTPQEVVAGSRIIITATSATQPLVRGEWLEPGTHINSIGGGGTRDIDGEAFRRSHIVVDSRQSALREALDVQEAIRAGFITEADLSTELGDVISGRAKGRMSLEEITLFRSLGLAMEDVATARLAFESAQALGIGREVDFP